MEQLYYVPFPLPSFPGMVVHVNFLSEKKDYFLLNALPASFSPSPHPLSAARAEGRRFPFPA
jgi:hypothetical protein